MRTLRSLLTTTVAIVATAAILAGCSSSSSNGGDSSVQPQDGHSGYDNDTVSAEDGQTGGDTYLPPQTECVVDADCPEDRFCDCNFRCEPLPAGGCRTDMECGATENYCEPCTRECTPKKILCEPCVSENRCDPTTGLCTPVGNQCVSPSPAGGSHCLDYAQGGSFCGQVCETNYGCEQGYECVQIPGYEEKQCVPTLGGCGQVVACEDDNDCDIGFICNANRVCGPGCEEDNQCQVGEVCSGYRCQQACDDTENPCPDGQYCDEGRCRIPGGCLDWTECEEFETWCNPDTNMCEPGCRERHDCKRSGYECQNNICEKRGCERNWYCAFGEECIKETGECVVPDEPHCEECDPDVENACGEGNECISLQDEDGNDLGDFCFVQCKPTELDRCPVGYECTPLKDQDGQVQNEVCGRDCSKPPAGLQY